MPAFLIGYRGYGDILAKTLLAVFISLSWVSAAVADDNTLQNRENYLRQLEEVQKKQVSIKIKENNVLLQAVSDIVTSKGKEKSKTILFRAKDARHKAIILRSEGKYIKAIDRITESTDFAVMAINRVEDGLIGIKDRELQQKIEGRLIEALTKLKDRMSLLLIQNKTFRVAAAKVLEKKREKELVDIVKEGDDLKRKAVAVMIDSGNYEMFKEYIKKSTNNFISVVTLAGGEEESRKTIEVNIIFQANKSLVNAASGALTGTDSKGAAVLFENVLRFRKNALILYLEGDYDRAIEDLKKSNDFAIKVIRLNVENIQS